MAQAVYYICSLKQSGKWDHPVFLFSIYVPCDAVSVRSYRLVKMTDLKKQGICIRFLPKLSETAAETHKMLRRAFGDNVLGLIETSEWFKRFGKGRLRLSSYVSFPKATRGVEPISYRGALLSTLLHATVYAFTQFAECASNNSVALVRERSIPTE
jgi:hypothetical protein